MAALKHSMHVANLPGGGGAVQCRATETATTTTLTVVTRAMLSQ